MDFLASYFGVAGALAYWQTKVNRKQDWKIERKKMDIEKQDLEIEKTQAILVCTDLSMCAEDIITAYAHRFKILC